MLRRAAVLLPIVALLATHAAVGAEGAEKVYRLGYLMGVLPGGQTAAEIQVLRDALFRQPVNGSG